MPFKSQAQRRWMYATHPAMAKRWEAATPKGRALPQRANTDTRQVNAPGRVKVKPHTGADDFKNLTPSASARFAPRGQPRPNLREADAEGGVKAMAGSRELRRAAIKKRKG